MPDRRQRHGLAPDGRVLIPPRLLTAAGRDEDDDLPLPPLPALDDAEDDPVVPEGAGLLVDAPALAEPEPIPVLTEEEEGLVPPLPDPVTAEPAPVLPIVLPWRTRVRVDPGDRVVDAVLDPSRARSCWRGEGDVPTRVRIAGLEVPLDPDPAPSEDPPLVLGRDLLAGRVLIRIPEEDPR